MATGLSRTGDGGVRCRTSPAQDRAIRRYGKQGATLKFKFYGNQLFKELDARSVGLFRRDPILRSQARILPAPCVSCSSYPTRM
jgi:hypothetical protein